MMLKIPLIKISKIDEKMKRKISLKNKRKYLNSVSGEVSFFFLVVIGVLVSDPDRMILELSTLKIWFCLWYI